MSVRSRIIVTALIVIAAAVLAYLTFSGTRGQRLDQSSFYDAMTARSFTLRFTFQGGNQ